jgi:hypothetical protein
MRPFQQFICPDFSYLILYLILCLQKVYFVSYLYKPLFAIVILSFLQLMISNIKSKLDIACKSDFLLKNKIFKAKTFSIFSQN